MSDNIHDLTQQIGANLQRNLQKICSAESCTGGLISKTLTDLAGSSDWFERGFVTYSNQAKVDMLGVKSSTLDMHGAVSEAVAAEMAAGALSHSEAQVAVSVTGIAGPGGGSPAKPVGTVCFGFAIDRRVLTERQVFPGNRAEVREASLLYVLNRLSDLLK